MESCKAGIEASAFETQRLLLSFDEEVMHLQVTQCTLAGWGLE